MSCVYCAPKSRMRMREVMRRVGWRGYGFKSLPGISEFRSPQVRLIGRHACCLTYRSTRGVCAMAEERSGYKHDASDKKLDQSADAANDGGGTSDTQHSSGP